MLIYPGSVHLFAGVAGTFKSMVTMAAVINMGVSTFVFSTDSDDLTMASRLLSVATGRPSTETRIMALRQPEAASRILADKYGHIKWSFDSDQDGDGIWHHLYAYATRHGDWPRLIVVDILSDVTFENAESEWTALRSSMKQLNIVARETNAAVILVHHASEAARTNDMYPCPGREAIMGKDPRHPVLMVTFGKDSQGVLHAACVKNRHDKADATGRTTFRMSVDPATSKVGDWTEQHRVLAAASAVGWRGWGEDPDDDE